MPDTPAAPSTEPKTTPTQAPAAPPQTPKPKLSLDLKKIPKLYLIIGGGFGVVFIMLLVLSLVTSQPSNKSSQTSPPPTATASKSPSPTFASTAVLETGVQLAEKMAKFANMYKSSNGTYPFVVNCNKAQTTENQNSSQSAQTNQVCQGNGEVVGGGILLPLSFYRVYKATGNPTFLGVADSELEKGIASCIQANDPNCYQYGLDLSFMYQDTSDPKYSEMAKQLIPSANNSVNNPPPDPLSKLLTAGRLVDMYALTKDNNYLKEAQVRYNQTRSDNSSQELYKNNETIVRVNDCQKLLSAVDFYRNLKEQRYLQDAQALIQRSEFAKNAKYFFTSYDFAPCIEAYLNLAELTNNQSYKEGAKQLTQNLVQKFMDDSVTKLFTPDYGIIYSLEPNAAIKDMNINYWIMGNLARFKDTKFQL